MNSIIILSIIFLICMVMYLLYKMHDSIHLWQKVIIGCSLVFMTLFELLDLSKVPGFFGDEAYTMYDSWAIAHYGLDRNLMHNAVYSLSSGGQSVLYEHLTIPFMKIFGMNLTAYRFPMAFFTVFSIILLIYALYRNNINGNIITGISFTLATAQWLLMYGHWAMDCNIAVPFFILMVDFILLGLTGKKYHLYIGIVFMLSLAYCYIGLWIVLPFIFIFTIYLLHKEHKITKFDIIWIFVISTVMLIPIFSYICVQFFKVPSFKNVWFSTASLHTTRANNSFISFDNEFFTSIISNVSTGLSEVMTGIDPSFYTSIPHYGLFHFINFTFMIYGIYKVLNQKKFNIVTKYLIYISISLIPIVIFIKADIWHWPSVFIIFSIWSGIGLGFFLKNHVHKTLKIVIIMILIIETNLFTKYYFTNYARDEIIANQLKGYSINYDQSKHFIKELQNLHVDTYYGIPFYPVSFMGCFIPTEPEKLKDLQSKWLSFIPNSIQPQSAAYIIPLDQKNNFQFLQGLPSKELEVNYSKYIVYYNYSHSE